MVEEIENSLISAVLGVDPSGDKDVAGEVRAGGDWFRRFQVFLDVVGG